MDDPRDDLMCYLYPQRHCIGNPCKDICERVERSIPAMIAINDLQEEIVNQDGNHPESYPYDRNGVRLGIAALEDEVNEVYEEWRNHKRHLGNCVNEIRSELLQVAAIAMRMIRELDSSK
jgi:hypothetical protein